MRLRKGNVTWVNGGSGRAFALLLTAACAANLFGCGTDPDGEKAMGGGSSNASGSGGAAAAGTAGAATSGSGGMTAGSGGMTAGSGGMTAGSGGAGGSSGGGGGKISCAPQDTGYSSAKTCASAGGIPPQSFKLTAPMTAGEPYAVVLRVTGDNPAQPQISGTNGECGAAAEQLLSETLSAGQHCVVLHPTAAHTDLLLSQTVIGAGVAIDDLCANGSCP